MRMLRLILNSLRHSPGRSLLLATPILLGAFALAILSSAYLLSRSFAVGTVSGLEENEMIVSPRLVEIPFLFRKSEVRPLSDEALSTITAIDGVSSAHPRYVLQGLASVRIAILDQTMESDTPIYGIDPGSFPPDLSSGNGTVPIMLSRGFVTLMGTTLAESLGFPRLSENLLIGRDVTVLTGYSSFFPSPDDSRQWPARIVGLSDHVPFVGLTIPLPDLERIARETGTETKVSDVLITLSPDADPAAVQQKIEALGFSTDSTSRRLGLLQERLSSLFLILSGITILLLTFVIVSVTSVTSSDVLLHTRQIGIMRSFGAGRRQIRAFFLARTMLVTLISAIVGTTLGITTTFPLHRTFLTSTVSWLGSETILLIFLLTVATLLTTAVLSSLLPILRANRLSPVRALGEEI